MHFFVARRRAVSIDFSAGDNWLRCRPKALPGVAIEEGFLRVGQYLLPLTPAETAAVQAVGAGSIAEIIARAPFAAFPQSERETFGRLCFEWLWKVGAVASELG